MTEKIRTYIRGFPPSQQKKLQEIYAIIKTVLPEETQEDIRWNIPSFYLNGYIVHFAAAKNHIGLYIGTAAMKAFENQLGKLQLRKVNNTTAI